IGFKGYVVGSPRYMAPEVFFGDAPPETEYLRDVYALGCLAFETLTGVHAFSADAAGEYMRMHMFEDAQRPSRVRPEVPAAFDAVIARALAKEPWDRTQSVAELRQQLVEAHESSREPERILVLDDDADWAELVSAVLRRRFRSARVDVIDNPQEALLAVDLERYSLIVADLQMPLLSGLEWTRRVRSTSRGKNLPIIIVTGSGGAAEWKEATSLGVAGVLLKPVHGDDLVNMVSRVLRETRASESPAAG
ncbi:MAG: response regulator, partial [Polyangiaceae bacterium]|nr:response regulator [Polyangiaceae bacterium]